MLEVLDQCSIEEQTLYLREQFQDIVGDHEEEPFCINNEDAEQFLAASAGDTLICVRAMKTIAVHLQKESAKGNRYMQEEIVALVSEEISKAIADTSKPTVVPSAPVKKLYQHSPSMADLAEEMGKRIPGHTFSEIEAKELFFKARKRPGIVLQSARSVGAYVASRIRIIPSHEDVWTRLLHQIERELGYIMDRQQTTK
jgi:hypothetical protein